MFDFLKKKDTEEKEEEQTQLTEADGPECSLCNQPGADKKYGGMYWHKKCLRKSRKMAKGMV